MDVINVRRSFRNGFHAFIGRTRCIVISRNIQGKSIRKPDLKGCKGGPSKLIILQVDIQQEFRFCFVLLSGFFYYLTLENVWLWQEKQPHLEE